MNPGFGPLKGNHQLGGVSRGHFSSHSLHLQGKSTYRSHFSPAPSAKSTGPPRKIGFQPPKRRGGPSPGPVRAPVSRGGSIARSLPDRIGSDRMGASCRPAPWSKVPKQGSGPWQRPVDVGHSAEGEKFSGALRGFWEGPEKFP